LIVRMDGYIYEGPWTLAAPVAPASGRTYNPNR
jgi:hypothetical protein